MEFIPSAPQGAGIRSVGVVALTIGSAGCYVGAMALMKLWDRHPPAAMGAALGLLVLAAVWLEILALRQARLSMVYVAILGAEAVMLMLVARFGFGETLAPREIAGAVLILAGTLLAAH